jgi:hypothetical protein
MIYKKTKEWEINFRKKKKADARGIGICIKGFFFLREWGKSDYLFQ